MANDFQYIFNHKWEIVARNKQDKSDIRRLSIGQLSFAFIDIICSMPRSLFRLDDNPYIITEKAEDGKDEKGNIKTKDVEDDEEASLVEDMLEVPSVFMAQQTYLRNGTVTFEIHTHQELTEEQVKILHKNVLECYPQDDIETYLSQTYAELGINDSFEYYLDVYE